jgi:hypothetical protein
MNDLGLAIFELKTGQELSLNVKHYLAPTVQRSLHLECLLEPGTYVVVPRTNGQGFKHGENAPLFENGRLSSKMLKSKGTLSYKDFSRVHEKLLQESLTQSIFSTKILSEHLSYLGRLTIEGLQSWFL